MIDIIDKQTQYIEFLESINIPSKISNIYIPSLSDSQKD